MASESHWRSEVVQMNCIDWMAGVSPSQEAVANFVR